MFQHDTQKNPCYEYEQLFSILCFVDVVSGEQREDLHSVHYGKIKQEIPGQA